MVLHEYLRHFADLPGDLLPLKESGVGNALRCWGQGNAMENANSDIQDALHRAEGAADATFLVKPVNQAMPQARALKSSRLLVVHNDAVARGVAHIKEAMKALSPYVPQQDRAKDHITVVSEDIFDNSAEKPKELTSLFRNGDDGCALH
ncbi:hypothetical protein FOZ60_008661 [Perkinsus olseni]|uniref:Uncharacterized protein n=1 Tax=Perkinsus olseni TaxID=32597 RepID=A0A7J6NIL5_PEROL|nr:hypothetical protein FOZ60_008661 [Perkinsus olseni]KAF4706252.1 hypothetical protein FOZ62_012322 [Perkinsus olseni]